MSALRPESEAELAAMLSDAAARGRRLEIQGGGTRGIGHAVAAEVLSTAGLSGITLYEPGALTLVAGAGTPLAEIEAALAAEGQALAFEPWDARAVTGAEGASTLGGVVATNASGPRRVMAGACRDSLIGVRFVDGTGSVIKNGGRVMKNVTGLDLVKLMAGSHGTLGVITQVGVKVLPASEAVATVVLDGLDVGRAVAAMTAAMATPYQVSAAAHVPQGFGEGPATLLRLEGFEGSVAHRSRALGEALAEHGQARLLEGREVWDWVRDARGFAGQAGDVWRISVKPTDGALVAAALPEAGLLMDWAGGLVWARVAAGTDLRAALHGVPGHATLIRATPEVRDRLGVFSPEPAPIAAISEGLRAKFDPHGILNPGRMGARAPVAA